MIFFLNCTATTTSTGIARKTTRASCQLIISMKIAAVAIFMMPQVTSRKPQVTNSATRSESDVTRDMIQPTGVTL